MSSRRFADLALRYEQRYHQKPTVFSRAPGRIEIIGNHTDHNGGRVVAAAIQQDTCVVAGPSKDTGLHLFSSGWDRAFTAPAAKDTETHDTEHLMEGVRQGLTQRHHSAPPYQAVMDSEVLPGSGMSSSAALEVALAGVHAALSGEKLDPMEAALAGQYAENRHMGKPSGLMDQLASALGGVNVLDFSLPGEPRHLQLSLGLQETNFQILVIHTGGSHADLTAQYAAVPKEMNEVAAVLGVKTLAQTNRHAVLTHLPAIREACGDRAIMRALHFFAEQGRVSALADAAVAGHLDRVLPIISESGLSSWTLLQNAYPAGADREQPLAMTLAVAATLLNAEGARGAVRLHGGGFAGTALAIVPEEMAEEFSLVLGGFLGTGSVVPVQISEDGLRYGALKDA